MRSRIFLAAVVVGLGLVVGAGAARADGSSSGSTGASGSSGSTGANPETLDPHDAVGCSSTGSGLELLLPVLGALFCLRKKRGAMLVMLGLALAAPARADTPPPPADKSSAKPASDSPAPPATPPAPNASVSTATEPPPTPEKPRRFVLATSGEHELGRSGGVVVLRFGYRIIPSLTLSAGGITAGIRSAGALVHLNWVPFLEQRMFHPVVAVGVPVFFNSPVETGGLASVGIEVVPVEMLAFSVEVAGMDLLAHGPFDSTYLMGGATLAMRF